MTKNSKITIDCPASLIEAGYGESIIAEAISGLCETEVDWLHEGCKDIHHTRRMWGEIKKAETQDAGAPKCLDDFLDKKIEQLESTVENLIVHGFDAQSHYKKLNAYRKVREEYEEEKLEKKMVKKVKFFSEPISDRINEENLSGLADFGITYDWGDSLITFYVQVDENRKIVRVGDDLYYLDGENGYCIHYCPVDNGHYARGIISELFECFEWFLFCGASND